MPHGGGKPSHVRRASIDDENGLKSGVGCCAPWDRLPRRGLDRL